MDILDVILVLVAGYCGWAGYRRGTVWVSLSLLGLIGGLILGAVLAGPVARLLAGNGATHAQMRALIASFVLVFLVIGLESLGAFLGHRWRARSRVTRLSRLDDTGGAALAVLGVLLMAWFLGQVFGNSRFAVLDSQIAGSAIVSNLNKAFSNPPGFLAQVELDLNDPNTLGGVLGGGDITQQAVPRAFNPIPAGLGLAQAQTVEVVSQSNACGGDSGSGFPIASNMIATAAHVVAGGTQVSVQTKTGATLLPAVVVLYDANLDVAVLYVPTGEFQVLPLAARDARPADLAAVVGYPLGGPQAVTAARVRGVESAQGPNLYLSGTVVRSLVVLATKLVGGDSGGPLLNLEGQVIGLTVATATTDSSEGFALAINEIKGDLTMALGRSAAVSTGGCLG